jgi:hypothetical protein
MTPANYSRIIQEIEVAKRTVPQRRRQLSALRKRLQESGSANNSGLEAMVNETNAIIRHIEAAYDSLQSIRGLVEQIHGSEFRLRLGYQVEDTTLDLVRCREF